MKRVLLLAAVMLAAFPPLPVAAAAAPTVPAVTDVQYTPDRGGRAGVIVTASLPETATLPAVVRLPLPPGATVTWAGEIIGDDPSQDIQRSYEAVEGAGGQAAEIRAERSRVVQYEADLGAASTEESATSAFEWVQSVEGEQLRFSLEMPPDAVDVETDPPYLGQPERAQDGSWFYVLAPRALQPGERFRLTVSFARRQQAGSSALARVLFPVLLASLAVAIVALVVALWAQARRRGPGSRGA